MSNPVIQAMNYDSYAVRPCCCNCHYFDKETNCCMRAGILSEEGLMGEIIDVSENGLLAEAIEESIDFDEIGNKINQELKYLFSDTRLSKKKQKEIFSAISEAIERMKTDVVENVDNDVSELYGNVNLKNRMEIANPRDFGCVYYE